MQLVYSLWLSKKKPNKEPDGQEKRGQGMGAGWLRFRPRANESRSASRMRRRSDVDQWQANCRSRWGSRKFATQTGALKGRERQKERGARVEELKSKHI